MPVRFIDEEYPHGFWIEDFQGKALKISRSVVLDLCPNYKGLTAPNATKKFDFVIRVD